MILTFLIAAAMLCGLVGVYGFVQYTRYRMKGLEKEEAYYQKLHYIALTLLFIIGILIMFYYGAQPDEYL